MPRTVFNNLRSFSRSLSFLAVIVFLFFAASSFAKASSGCGKEQVDLQISQPVTGSATGNEFVPKNFYTEGTYSLADVDPQCMRVELPTHLTISRHQCNPFYFHTTINAP
jgi:hypothetical protein